MGIRLMILSLLALYLLEQIHRGHVELNVSPVLASVGAYLVLAGFSTWLSPYLHQSLQWMVTLSFYAILFLVFMSVVRDGEGLNRLIVVFISVSAFEAMLTLLQAWKGTARPSGTFFNPNFLAGYLSMAWSILLAQVCYGSSKLRTALISWPLLGKLILLVLMFSAVIVTGSRGGMLALSVASLLVLSVRFGWAGVGAVLLLCAACLLIPNPWMDRLKAEHTLNYATYARLEIWKATFSEMLTHPFGIGLGLFQYAAPRFAFPLEGAITRYGKLAETAHNEYLQMGIELGVASVFIFTWGLIHLAMATRDTLARCLSWSDRTYVIGAAGAVASVTCHAAVDSNLHEPAIAVALVFFAGVILAKNRIAVGGCCQVVRVDTMHRWLWETLVVVSVLALTIHVIRVGWAWELFALGYQSFRAHAIEDAIKDYRSAIVLDPGKAQYHGALAAPLLDRVSQWGDWTAGEVAIGEVKMAIRLNPLDGRLRGELGRVYASLAAMGAERGSPVSLGQRKQWLSLALSSYREAVRLEPYTAPYWLEYARVELALGDWAEGERILLRAVELEPNLLPARAHLAEVYLRTSRTDLAVHEYREITDRQRRYEYWHKDPDEKRFLAADTDALIKELAKRGVKL
jgi:tetratricopeptide (TPR) repeat protein